jgi:putative transposase
MRLKGYDYTQPGYYFVTICTYRRKELFGKIAGEEMRLNEYGLIVKKCWEEIPAHFSNVNLDYFIIMPNHIHGIIEITDCQNSVEERHASLLQNMDDLDISPGVKRGSLGAIIGSFKAAVTRQINLSNKPLNVKIWQQGYFDHIVRKETSLDMIRKYIENNVLQWYLDHDESENLFYKC